MNPKALPRYVCHKVVHAARILDIDDTPKRTGLLLQVEGLPERVEVDQAYVAKHLPRTGGYFVVYEDGYQSWSPGEAFERGYNREDGS